MPEAPDALMAGWKWHGISARDGTTSIPESTPGSFNAMRHHSRTLLGALIFNG